MTASLPRMSIVRNQAAHICRVLIVAGNPELRRLLDYIFNGAEGYAGDSVATEAEANHYIAQRHYQAVIYDADKFADASGLLALAETSTSAHTQRTKTVVLTSYGHLDQEYEVLTDTFDLCLNKPFTQRQILDCLSKLVDNDGA